MPLLKYIRMVQSVYRSSTFFSIDNSLLKNRDMYSTNGSNKQKLIWKPLDERVNYRTLYDDIDRLKKFDMTSMTWAVKLYNAVNKAKRSSDDRDSTATKLDEAHELSLRDLEITNKAIDDLQLGKIHPYRLTLDICNSFMRIREYFEFANTSYAYRGTYVDLFNDAVHPDQLREDFLSVCCAIYVFIETYPAGFSLFPGVRATALAHGGIETLRTVGHQLSAFHANSLPRERFCIEVQPGAGHDVYTGNERAWGNEGFAGCTPALAELDKKFPHDKAKLYVLSSMTVENQIKAIKDKGIKSDITFICDPRGMLRYKFPSTVIASHVVYPPSFCIFDKDENGEMICVFADRARTPIDKVLELVSKPTSELLAMELQSHNSEDNLETESFEMNKTI